ERPEVRNSLLEQLHPLARDLQGQEGAPGEVATRPRQTLREPGLDRIPTDDEDDGNVLDRPRRPRRREAGDNDRYPRLRQLRRSGTQRLQVSLSVSRLEDNALSLDVAELAETFAKPVQERIGLRTGRQPADARRHRSLLGTCRRRQQRRHEAEE